MNAYYASKTLISDKYKIINNNRNCMI